MATETGKFMKLRVLAIAAAYIALLGLGMGCTKAAVIEESGASTNTTEGTSTPILPKSLSSVPVWNVFEITLTASRTYANPFSEVDVSATFLGPNGLRITRPAYWDGGQTWKIRFAPTAVGKWTYTTSCPPGLDRGLDGQTGAVNAVNYAGATLTLKHGFPKSSARHLTYQNGLPFFWLGAEMAMIDVGRINETNKYDWNPKPDHASSQVYGILENLALKQFNVVNFAFFDKWTVDAPGGRTVNLNKFTNLYDPVMKFAVDRGFSVLLAVGYNSEMDAGLDANLKYARYLVARYGAYPVMWTVGEPDYPVTVADYGPKWGQVLASVASMDDYRHPIGPWYRQTALGSETPTLYLDQPWVSLIVHQCGHTFAPGNFSLGGSQPSWKYQFYRDQFPHLPMVEAGGCNYEQIYAGVDDYVARRSAWRAVMAGSAGFGHGAEGIWNMNWDAENPTLNYGSQNIPWFRGIDAPSSWQMAFLKYFVTATPWYTMYPLNGANSVVNWAYGSTLSDTAKPLVLGDVGLKNVIAYIPKEFSSIAGPSGGIYALSSPAYVVQWYNPRNGNLVVVDADMRPGLYGTYVIPSKPDTEDWVLWIMGK